MCRLYEGCRTRGICGAKDRTRSILKPELRRREQRWTSMRLRGCYSRGIRLGTPRTAEICLLPPLPPLPHKRCLPVTRSRRSHLPQSPGGGKPYPPLLAAQSLLKSLRKLLLPFLPRQQAIPSHPLLPYMELNPLHPLPDVRQHNQSQLRLLMHSIRDLQRLP